MADGPMRPSRRAPGGREAAPPRPALPDERADLPRGVAREIRRQAPDAIADDVALALSIGSAAIDEGLLDVALEHLRWAKHQVPRSAAVREALGVAAYLSEDYRGARTELQAYRRLTSRNDQNHVLADCERAVRGDETSRVGALVESMQADEAVPRERQIEGLIVWAAALADADDLGAARAVARRGLSYTDGAGDAELRLSYVAADLAVRAGDTVEARELFERVLAVDDNFLDVAERLAEL